MLPFRLFSIPQLHSALWRLLGGSEWLMPKSGSPHRQPVPDWCQPTWSPTHNENTQGFPVLSGGHSSFCPFSLLSIISVFSTHPLSSGRASLGFEHIRQQPWGTHPTHQLWESYSRKERLLVQDMSGQKQKIWGSFGKWCCTQIKNMGLLITSESF